MEVTQGLKRTDVGVIPSDWEILPFRKAVRTYIDYRGRTPRKLGMTWGGGEILALSANNVQMGRIDVAKEAYVGSAELYRKWMTKGDCERGDVLLTMEAPLGNVAQIPDERRYILSQRVLLIKPNDWVLRDYIAHFMMGTYFQTLLDQHSTGTTAKGIQRAKLDHLMIYLPPRKTEQEAIAGALSDADRLIESLERLIAKKRQLNQAALLNLLTPTSNWIERRLGDIAVIRDGTHQTPSYVNAGIPFYSVENVTSGNFVDTKFVSETDHRELTRSFRIAKGDILMTRIGSIGDCKLIDWDVNASFYVSLALLKVRKEYSPAFICHYSRTTAFQRDVELHSLRSAIPRKINLGPISQVRVWMPETLSEQNTIARVLTEMDREVEILGNKLDKARQIKQGMMPTLLRGKVRLV